jgi:hypothetical protein
MKKVGLGVGLAVSALLLIAPPLLGMWGGASSGAEMMGDFEPFMKARVLNAYQDQLTVIDSAAQASRETLPHALHGNGVSPTRFAERYPAVVDFGDKWPGIARDFRGNMLEQMGGAVADLEAIGGIPPMGVMPYALVVFGLVVLVLTARAYRKPGASVAAFSLLLVGLTMTVALVAIGAVSKAQTAESMFGRMKPFMTHSYMSEMQQRFLTVGSAEGQLRNDLIPAYEKLGAGPVLHEARAMVKVWPNMAADMAPMMGAMSDNIDNFRAAAAMPAFPAMAWTFVLIGIALSLSGALLFLPPITSSKRVAAGVAAMLLLGACGTSAGSTGSEGDELVGLFRLDNGKCHGSKATGSYTRMIQPNGKLGAGPFVDNADSKCPDGTFTLLSPGTDGGLITGEYQSLPKQAFDKKGNSLAASIMKPLSFYAVHYSAATNEKDPQTGETVDPPKLWVDQAGHLAGSIEGWAVSWNRQHFNQGGPKPGGETPGLTTEPTGTYDSKTGRFTLEWASLVQGGPFDGFTGFWHLEGVFEAR